MRRAKKKRLARMFAVITAVSLLSLFIVRNVVRENLKHVHDSLAQAKAHYEILYEQRQNDSAVQSGGQTFNNLQKKFKFQNPPDRPGQVQVPWKPALASDIADLHAQAFLTLNKTQDELYFVSELIDALPSSAADLRKFRDESRVHLEQDGKSVSAIGPIMVNAPPGLLEPEVTLPAHPGPLDSRKAWEVYETIVTEHGKVLQLAALSITAARRTMEVMEHRIRICSYIIYFLGVVVAALGIYVAIVLKPEGNEANR
jgi:hypothetical protein